MTSTQQAQFDSFFKTYSKNVDNAQQVAFWKLLDEIIFSIITKHIPRSLKGTQVILDAGGGTGRWIEILSHVYKSKFILYDKSRDMLRVAQSKATLNKLGDRLSIVEGDIQKMFTIPDKSIDYLISIYNPISFVEKPSLFFREIRRILRPKGKALIMGQGLHNALASKVNTYLASDVELRLLDKKAKVKWTKYVPELHVFSKESFEKLAQKAGLSIVSLYGVSVFVQPGPEDFDPENKKLSKISRQLKIDKNFYRHLLKLEMKYNSYDSLVNRGMNILVVLQNS